MERTVELLLSMAMTPAHPGRNAIPAPTTTPAATVLNFDMLLILKKGLLPPLIPRQSASVQWKSRPVTSRIASGAVPRDRRALQNLITRPESVTMTCVNFRESS